MGRTKTIIGKVGMTPKGAYQAGTVYDKLDMVTLNGVMYVSLVAANSSLPTDASKWMPQSCRDEIIDYDTETAEIPSDALNRWGEVTELTITLAQGDNTKVEEYRLEFTVSGDSFAFHCEGIRWMNDEEPDWKDGYTYQVSILNGLAVAGRWEATEE